MHGAAARRVGHRDVPDDIFAGAKMHGVAARRARARMARVTCSLRSRGIYAFGREHEPGAISLNQNSAHLCRSTNARRTRPKGRAQGRAR